MAKGKQMLGALLMGAKPEEMDEAPEDMPATEPLGEEEAETAALQDAFDAVKEGDFGAFAEAMRAFVDVRTGGEG